jgi:hypothetical protein
MLRTFVVASVAILAASSASAFKIGIIAFQMSAETHARCSNSAADAAKKLGDKDDPTLKCTPTALGTLNVSMFDVGAVGQIVATPKFVVMLTETFHAYRIVPTDGRAHREEVPPSYRGDSIGHWESDVFVVETKNFTDDTWMWAEGRVSPHSDQLSVVERYRRLDKDTLQIDAVVTDPKMLTGPWTVPTQTLVLAPFDQIMPLICSGVETGALMDAAAKQNAQPAPAKEHPSHHRFSLSM